MGTGQGASLSNGGEKPEERCNRPTACSHQSQNFDLNLLRTYVYTEERARERTDQWTAAANTHLLSSHETLSLSGSQEDPLEERK